MNTMANKSKVYQRLWVLRRFKSGEYDWYDTEII